MRKKKKFNISLLAYVLCAIMIIIIIPCVSDISGDVFRSKGRMSGYEEDSLYNDFIENRVLCTANYSHLFILPDGKVTICKQLYWNSKFIVGDILESSLAEIWTSDKAKYLYNLPQKDISDESSCKTCKVYTICRQQSGGVCWKEVIAAYGTDKWDYPDPSCPHAPNIYNDIYL